MTESFEQMWAALAAIGKDPSSGGYHRGGWTPTERAATDWFTDQCAARGLALESDGLGNLVAWWAPSSVPPPASGTAAGPAAAGGAGVPNVPGVVTGSHLDSVIDGGAFDGPLGVVSALAAVDRLRAEGFEPSVPIGVGAFVEEEGSRFGMPCLGSRVATGVLPAEKALALQDRAGVPLRTALSELGIDPAGVGPSPLLDRMATFVELHVEQGRALTAPVGVASSIWPHGRFRFTFSGEANHAGTTLMEDRHDPMLTYAMTALAANKQARLAGARATFGRLSVEPNGTNAVPSQVTAWLDARAASDDVLQSLLAAIT
ncbi:MAG TPA: allantoate amidohydrolase, partial [Kribbella sp.]